MKTECLTICQSYAGAWIGSRQWRNGNDEGKDVLWLNQQVSCLRQWFVIIIIIIIRSCSDEMANSSTAREAEVEVSSSTCPRRQSSGNMAVTDGDSSPPTELLNNGQRRRSLADGHQHAVPTGLCSAQPVRLTYNLQSHLRILLRTI